MLPGRSRVGDTNAKTKQAKPPKNERSFDFGHTNEDCELQVLRPDIISCSKYLNSINTLKQNS